MTSELIFRIILQQPPAGVDFGLQKGGGNNYETIQKQRSVGDDLQFEFPVRLKPGISPFVDFSGPFVQGRPAERFVYIDIGLCAGQTDTNWSRRLKIPLKGITTDMIDKVRNAPKKMLTTTVPGTGRDGGPSCATVKPFAGWKVESIT